MPRARVEVEAAMCFGIERMRAAVERARRKGRGKSNSAETPQPCDDAALDEPQAIALTLPSVRLSSGDFERQ